MNAQEPGFAVVWPDYSTKISNGYTRFQQLEEFVDMTLAADGHYVKVHQFIVALASPYLKEIIKSIPVKHPVIFLNNVSYVELCQLLEYIYTGEVEVPRHFLEGFMKCAKALKLEGLCEARADMQPNVVRAQTKPDYFQEPFDITINEEPLQGTDAAAETVSITSELERRISCVQDDSIDVVEEIMEVKPSFRSSNNQNISNKNLNKAGFVFSTETQQNQADTVKRNNIKQDIDNFIIEENNAMDENFLDNLQDQSNQGQELPSTSGQNALEMPRNTTKSSGKMSNIGKKTITVLNKTLKRKAGPKSELPQRKVQKLRTAKISLKVPSIVIESNVGGHSITIQNPSEISLTQSNEMAIAPEQGIGKSMPSLTSSPLQLTPWTTLEPNYAETAQNQEANVIPQRLTTTQQMPQIILAPNAPPIITEPEYIEVPLTPALPVSNADALVDLDNMNEEERISMETQLKDGAPQLYTISNQGSIQLILNRYMYYPHYQAYGGRKRRWRCVDYRRKQCRAYLDTDGETINKRVNTHTHPFHDERILLKLQKKQVFSTIASATAKNATLGGATASSEDIE